MMKSSNTFLKKKPIHYSQLINVWIEDTKRIEAVKIMMIENKNFKLEKLKYNPLYKEVYSSIVKERDTELEKLDNSLLWSRRYQKKDFFEFAIPFGIYCFVLIPYIFYKVLHKRILEQHVKNGYTAENLKDYNYWNLDFENKDIYPDSVIKLYFDMKSVQHQREEKEEIAKAYNKEFVSTITNGYLNDMVQRRMALGFNDDEDDD